MVYKVLAFLVAGLMLYPSIGSTAQVGPPSIGYTTGGEPVYAWSPTKAEREQAAEKAAERNRQLQDERDAAEKAAEEARTPATPPHSSKGSHMIGVQVTKGREAMKLQHQSGGTEWLIADGNEVDHGFWVLGPDEKAIEHQGDQSKEYSGKSQGEVAQKQK
jgi:hypothetical protein